MVVGVVAAEITNAAEHSFTGETSRRDNSPQSG
jgi:hypothetical protein